MTRDCDYCSLKSDIVAVFPGCPVTITASTGLPSDIFPVGSVDGDWLACGHCAALDHRNDKDASVTSVSDRIVGFYRHPLMGHASVQPKVIALLARYWGCIESRQRSWHVIDDLVTPNQKVLMDIYRNTQSSECPGGHVFARRTNEGVHLSAYLRFSARTSAYVVYFYDIFSEHRNQGCASVVMRQLVNSANRHRVVVELPVMANDTPSYGKGLTSEELIAWYTRHGFQLMPGEASPAGHPLMRRMPR